MTTILQQHTAGRDCVARDANHSDSAIRIVGRCVSLVALSTVLGAASFAACQPRTAPQTPDFGGSSAAAEKRYYLALGNSLATGGDDTTRLIRPRVGLGHFANGYAHPLYMMARSRIPELEHVHFACGGETAYGMIHGGAHGWEGPPPYGTCPTLLRERSQLAEAVSFLNTHAKDVAFVTIDIGGNDLITCFQTLDEPLDLERAFAYYSSPRARRACLDRIQQNLRRIATELRTAAGPDTRIVAMNGMSIPLASWLTGPDGRLVATQLTDSVIVPFNAAREEAFAAADIRTADVAAAFSTTDYTLVTDPDFGEVPLNVLRICQWTRMCSAGDFHPNTEGNRVIVEAFAAALGL